MIQGPAETIADDPRVPASVDHGTRDAQLLQHRDAPIHCVALGDTAKVDAHPGVVKEYRLRGQDPSGCAGSCFAAGAEAICASEGRTCSG